MNHTVNSQARGSKAQRWNYIPELTPEALVFYRDLGSIMDNMDNNHPLL